METKVMKFNNDGSLKIGDIQNIELEINSKASEAHNHDTDYLRLTEKAVDSDKLSGAVKNIDGTLSGNSDNSIPTEKAIKTYVDTEINKLLSEIDSLRVYQGDCIINNQNDLMNLSWYQSITGSLIIEETTLITLNNLKLTSIGGNLSIFYNQNLTDINGLNNITTINGNVQIEDNHILSNLDGLSNLTSIKGNCEISDNFTLSNIDGLSNLTTIGGYLWFIYNNEVITNINGFNNLTSVGGNMAIECHDELISLSGLSNLTYVGGNLYITDNEKLTSLDMDSLEKVGITNDGSISIIDNPLLPQSEIDSFLVQIGRSS